MDRWCWCYFCQRWWFYIRYDQEIDKRRIESIWKKNPNNNEIINLQIVSFRGTNILMSKVYVSVTTAVALISLNMSGETMRLSSDIVIVTRISLNNQDMRFLFFPLFRILLLLAISKKNFKNRIIILSISGLLIYEK